MPRKISPSPADAMQLHGREMAAPMTQLVNQNAPSLYRRDVATTGIAFTARSERMKELLQVMLRLCTNIEPGHGGRLGMGSLLGCTGRPWEYTGPASLLKSALQKNIRCMRAGEAVRCVQHHCALLAILVSGVRICSRKGFSCRPMSEFAQNAAWQRRALRLCLGAPGLRSGCCSPNRASCCVGLASSPWRYI